MAVLNHHIVASRDKRATAVFFAEMLGFDEPIELGHFAVVKVSPDTTLDFVDSGGEIAPLHYAFLVSEEEFDDIFERIKRRGLKFWSDPFRHDPDNINHWDDGRGVYFDDPNGHLLEILTRPYGSAGTSAQHPHPLVAPRIETDGDAAS